MMFVLYGLVLLLAVLWLKNKDRNSKLSKIPGPKGVPYFGNIFDFMIERDELWLKREKHVHTYKRVYKLKMLNVTVISVVHPDDVETVFSSTVNIEKSRVYNLLHPWLGTGLLTSTGQKWQTRRKILTPAFHFNILRGFTITFGEQSQKLVERLRKTNGSSVNVIPLIMDTTLHSLCETSMGTSLDENDSSISEYKEAIYKFGDLSNYRIFHPWLYNPFILNLSSTGKKLNKVIKILHKFTRDIINKRTQNWKDDTIRNYGDSSGKQRLAMLDLLISQKEKGANITTEGIAEEVDTFVFEGHDTTAMGISFALLLLANNKNAQDLAYEEQKHIFGDDRDRLPTYNDLQEMTYLEMCIKETLRLYPPVHFVSRKVTDEMKLGGYTIPVDCSVNIHIFYVHRHPDFWPDPEKFDPERFSSDNSQKRHPFAYVPFSAGSRNCIGQKFAMLELKTLLSSILRNFELKPVTTLKDLVLIPDLVIRAKNGIDVRFCKRNL